MQWNEAAPAIEAILFVAGEPVAVSELCRALELTDIEVTLALNDAEKSLEGHGIRLMRYGDHVRLETRAEYAESVQRMLRPVQKQTLTQTVLETLAVIAYRQPVTKQEIELLRGVKCDYSVQLLLSHGLITECGRRETLGRPILYATTDRFLEHFGISDIRELPPPPAELPAEDGELPIPVTIEENQEKQHSESEGESQP